MKTKGGEGVRKTSQPGEEMTLKRHKKYEPAMNKKGALGQAVFQGAIKGAPQEEKRTQARNRWQSWGPEGGSDWFWIKRREVRDGGRRS